MTIIKRAISIYYIPNTSQGLHWAFYVHLLHNSFKEVGVKSPFYYYQVYNLFLAVRGRRRTLDQGSERAGIFRSCRN